MSCLFLLITGACQQQPPVIRQQKVLDALETTVIYAQSTNYWALTNLKRGVKHYGNSAEGLERIRRCEVLRKRAVDMVGNVEKLKQTLIKEAGQGVDTNTHRINERFNIDVTKKIMKVAAVKLSKQLNKYSRWIDSEHKDLDLPEFELLGEGTQQLSFYEAYFRGSNLIEVLIMLTERQLGILRYQSEVLKKFGAGEFLG